MTEKEIAERLEELIVDRKSHLSGDMNFDELFYKDIEVLEMAKRAVECYIPVKPHVTKRGIFRCECCKRKLRCPIEPTVLINGKVKRRKGDSYCPECGQAIDWSETNV